jgi:uncharacterized tellurite resistance protein B-like protein
MPVVEPHIEKFYQSIAYIFYAVAAVDGSIRIEEKRKIKKLVDEHWTFKEENINSNDIIFSTLKKVIEKEYSTDNAFQNFKEFFLEHPELFSDQTKKEIMDNANRITMAFHSRNKSESVLLGQLYFLLYNSKKKD